MTARALLAGALVALAASAGAAELEHTLRTGEGLDAVAERYYDRAQLAPFVAAYNGFEDAVPPGAALRIPSAEPHRVAPTEAWSDLARHHWGESDLGSQLAYFLDRDAELDPIPGEVLAIPVLVPWTIGSGESFAGAGAGSATSPSQRRKKWLGTR